MRNFDNCPKCGGETMSTAPDAEGIVEAYCTICSWGMLIDQEKREAPVTMSFTYNHSISSETVSATAYCKSLAEATSLLELVVGVGHKLTSATITFKS